MTPRFPKYQGVAHLLKAKNSLVFKVPGELDSPVGTLEPASHFTVCVNLQAHATAFKTTLIKKKLFKSNVNYTNTFDLCLKIFPSPSI